jgi:hypothetical protein
MSIPDWATTIGGALAVLSAIWAVHRFTTRAMIKDYLVELRPNGGSSVKDKVDNIDQKVEKLESRIDQIYFLIVTEGRSHDSRNRSK